MVPNEELPSLPLPSGRKPSYAVVLVTIMSMIVEPIVPTCEGEGGGGGRWACTSRYAHCMEPEMSHGAGAPFICHV